MEKSKDYSSVMIPIHLIGFDVFAELKKWKNENVRLRPFWTIIPDDHPSDLIQCRLEWKFGDSQLGSILRIATSPQEAVWLALEEFDSIKSRIPTPR